MFVIFQANLNSIVIATQKELLEMDITNVLTPPAFLEDDTEYDIEVIRKYVSFKQPLVCRRMC